jgi:stage III sporulation protein AF
VILSRFIELLSPAGELKKYVRFASGLIIILMMAKPLLRIGNLQLPVIEPLRQERYAAANARDVYVNRLEKNVAAAVGADAVEITVDAENPTEILYVKSKVKRAEIAGYLGIPPDRVGD